MVATITLDFLDCRCVRMFVNAFGIYSFTYIYFFREQQYVGDQLGNTQYLIYGLEHLLEIGKL